MRRPILTRPISRRRFLAASGIAGAGLLALANTDCDPTIIRRLRQVESRRFPQHSVWIWQFSIDGEAQAAAEALASRGLSAIVKTHDGIEWMAAYDSVPGAIAGPAEVAAAAATFEQAGVPFHAWAVVKGVDPGREAEMAAAVLDAGARSLTLDLEDGDGFWAGTTEDAVQFGVELRARQPDARIDVSIDPRPWKLHHIPLHEFVAFCDGIRPQLYWDEFDDEDHINAYRYMGFDPGEAGITPEFLVEASHRLIAPLDRWIVPIGFGAPEDPAAWARFMRRCWELHMPEVSAWRFGTTAPEVFHALAAYPPMAEPPAT
jgi:hypothetical protein